MNTVLSRANSLFAFSLSVMAALTFGCFITTAFKDRSVPVDIQVSKVMIKNVDDFTGPRERSDLGFVTFDISANILLTEQTTPIFDWNVKELFLYLTAEYSTKSNVSLDRFSLSRESVGLVNTMNCSVDGNLANKNITLTLSWNVVPNAGILPSVMGSGHKSLAFPETYETAKSY
uniref:Signal peptidase complex subunit 3 n=1 Tax=Cyprinus carpio TaxID=7962 RepID=A0A8C2I0I0_CYPCA